MYFRPVSSLMSHVTRTRRSSSSVHFGVWSRARAGVGGLADDGVTRQIPYQITSFTPIDVTLTCSVVTRGYRRLSITSTRLLREHVEQFVEHRGARPLTHAHKVPAVEVAIVDGFVGPRI
eukprot:scaffold49611_cov66-Phaeocystis_antarctica.AAC.5